MAVFSAVTAGTRGPRTVKLWYRPEGEDADIAFPTTGYTVEMILRDGNGALVSELGTLVPKNQTTNPGELVHTPAALTYNPAVFTHPRTRLDWTVRFKVTDGLSVPKYFPEGAPDTIPVFKP